MHTLTSESLNLWNEDLKSTETSDRTRRWHHFASFWIGMVMYIPAYVLASGLINEGMSPYEAIVTVLVGYAIVLMSPPFRNKLHQDSLWAGLSSGSLQVVATDHCAFSQFQKRHGSDDFRRIPNGTGGLQHRMRVLWSAGVNTGRLTREEFVAVTSTNAARIFNMYPRKGAIRPGSDADIVVWDPNAATTIRAEGQVSRAEYNVFEGYACRGLPVMTFLRGVLAHGPGGLQAETGRGRYLRRDPHPAVTLANRIRYEATRPVSVSRQHELVP